MRLASDMKTPICDFANKYANESKTRLHMPGHKGKSFLGVEQLDITEIEGADSLYEASGIIAESERNASMLFGCDTYYSTEGSSLCIRAMLHLAALYARARGEEPSILATRNAHKTFLSAIALLDINVEWLTPKTMTTYLSCEISAEYLREYLGAVEKKPTALYITSPDYLGNIADIKELAIVCHGFGVLLIVDNAHGAYLRFLSPSQHPIDLGADICCDSAHKTLPVLTGGAYLHLSNRVSEELSPFVKDSMLLFGSTSPSYLILQSLDRANLYLDTHSARLDSFVKRVDALKKALVDHGYLLYGNEPLKITVCAKQYGYYGYELASALEERGFVCEFADPDFVTLMLTPENDADLDRVQEVLLSICARERIEVPFPVFCGAKRVLSVREASLSPFEKVDIDSSLGRIASLSSVGCPPAVPIVLSGEIIDENAIECFKYYGINKVYVIK